MSASGWEQMADWWDENLGDEGDLWHRTLIDPPLLCLVGNVHGQRVLPPGPQHARLPEKFFPWQLSNSIQSKIVAMAFAMAAEIERDLISQRNTEALQVRKQQGMSLGRPKCVGKSKLDAYQVEIIALLKNGTTKTWIARKYGTTRRNLSYWMKQHGITQESFF